jgi:hypothetical protein
VHVPRRDPEHLAQASRWIVAGTHEAAEVALGLLDAAGEFFERGILLLREEGRLRPVGAIVQHGDRPPASLLAGTALADDGPDFLARSVREGRPYAGPAPVAASDVAVLGFLGTEHPVRVAVVPLIADGRCFALLYGDDGGDDEAPFDAAPLTAFLADASPAFSAALAVAGRRAETRRLRRST